MNVTWTPQIVAAVLAFVGVLIFVHELGHFLAAKLFDIKVLKFSLGFGPPLVAFTKGETTYQIALVPLGGYVKMVGQDPHDEIEPEDRTRAFSTAPVYQRAIVALAGPAFNLLFPVLCFFAYNLLEPTEEAPMVGTVEVGKPAQRAGLMPGDRVVELDHERVWSFERMTDLVRARGGQTVSMVVDRDGEKVPLEITPDTVTSFDQFGRPVEYGQIGVTPSIPAARIGVEDPAKSPPGVRTGDRVLAVDGHPITMAHELDRALKRAAGRTVKVTLARPEPMEGGGLLVADAEVPVTLEATVPAGATGMADLGWAPSGAFVRAVVPGGAAERAGIRSGDWLVAVNGHPFRLFWSFLHAVETSDGKPLTVTVVRDGRRVDETLTPDKVTCINPVTQNDFELYDHGLGTRLYTQGGATPPCEVVAEGMLTRSHWASDLPALVEPVRLSVGEAFLLGLQQTGASMGSVGVSLVRFFTLEVSYKNLGGPITFFRVAAVAAERGVFNYLSMLAVLSINLAFLNLLPIPILDGGHLLFCLIEAVKRQPVSLRVKEAAMMVGLVLLVALFGLAFGNDLGLFKSSEPSSTVDGR
ncbi:MAG: RIP metalloprotease RseP [Deltaproteobacteria bacterium]|nr:RIP metalloprotease RseP [Deltaproteobacteria bacterium]